MRLLRSVLGNKATHRGVVGHPPHGLVLAGPLVEVDLFRGAAEQEILLKAGGACPDHKGSHLLT